MGTPARVYPRTARRVTDPLGRDVFVGPVHPRLVLHTEVADQRYRVAVRVGGRGQLDAFADGFDFASVHAATGELIPGGREVVHGEVQQPGPPRQNRTVRSRRRQLLAGLSGR